MACAFWSVFEDGLIRIERFERSGRFLQKDRPAIRPILVRDEPRVGAEAGVLHAIRTRAEPDDSIADVVARSKNKDKPPLHPAWDIARELLIERGFGARVGRVFITRKLVWDCERIAALEPEFEEIWGRWERFGEHEHDLRDALVEECRTGRAIRRGVDTPTFTSVES